MIDRGKALFLLVLGILILFIPVSLGATCPAGIQSDGNELTEGFFFSNILLCPYGPNEPEKPKCPSQINMAQFTVNPPDNFPAYFDNLYGRYRNVAEGNVRSAAEGEQDVVVQLDVSGLCFEGEEGQYYVWYQADLAAGPSEIPTEGYCYETAHVVDWDQSNGEYCLEDCVGSQVSALAGATASCCGDDPCAGDPECDCARKSALGQEYACTQQGSDWSWKGAVDNTGNILELSCEDISLVSDGSNFLKCTDNSSLGPGFDTLNFEYISKAGKQHMYVCFDDIAGGKKIAECSGTARISSSGLAKDTGESVLVDNTTYFCVSDRARQDDLAMWISNLDDLGEINKADCAIAKKPDGSPAGYIWTGTKCCAEPEDGDEYYNDRGGYNESEPTPGGCWNKQHILSGLAPPGRLLFDVINYKGGFEGCKIQGEDPVLTINDLHTSQLLVSNDEYCTLLEDARGTGEHLFCSFNGNWVATSNVDKDTLKTTEWDDGKGCCESTQCWDSDTQSCINDQSQSSLPVTYHGYRCMNGLWDNSSVSKFTWDGSETGFCPSEDYCLVNPSPFAPVNCISNGDYDENKYCDNGEWTSRARLLALALLQYASSKSPEEHTLFCDNYDNILNYYNYEVGGQSLSTYLGESYCSGKPCVNEFCVLKYPEGIAFGTAVNEPIDSPRSFLAALDKPTSLCDDALIADNQYHSCDENTWYIWYNQGHGIIIQFSEPTQLGAVSWGEAFVAFIKNPFETIKDWIVPRTAEFGFFNQTRMFTKIYADVHGTKKVFAFLEEGQTVYVDDWPLRDVDYLGLEYHELGITPCSLIRNYDSSISCTSDQTIFAQSRIGSQKNLVDAWPDLTAKLRIR